MAPAWCLPDRTAIESGRGTPPRGLPVLWADVHALNPPHVRRPPVAPLKGDHELRYDLRRGGRKGGPRWMAARLRAGLRLVRPAAAARRPHLAMQLQHVVPGCHLVPQHGVHALAYGVWRQGQVLGLLWHAAAAADVRSCMQNCVRCPQIAAGTRGRHASMLCTCAMAMLLAVSTSRSSGRPILNCRPSPVMLKVCSSCDSTFQPRGARCADGPAEPNGHPAGSCDAHGPRRQPGEFLRTSISVLRSVHAPEARSSISAQIPADRRRPGSARTAWLGSLRHA